jgi:branched-chain amino acid aminotransferase
MGNYCYFNGAIIKEVDAKVGVTDLGLRRAYGAFDFLRAEGVFPLFIEHHLVRFKKALKSLRIPIKEDEHRLQEIVNELLTLNNYKNSGLRFIATGGYSEDSYHPTTPNFFITNDPIGSPAKELYSEGVDLMLLPHKRELANYKTINYLTPIFHLEKMHKELFYDQLYHDKGIISEASRANFFVVINQTLYTPKEGVLEGVTRKMVLQIAKEQQIPVKITDVSLSDLTKASEAFMCSTTKRVLPVTKVDHQEVGDGKVGKMTKRLMSLFAEMEQFYIDAHA